MINNYIQLSTFGFVIIYSFVYTLSYIKSNKRGHDITPLVAVVLPGFVWLACRFNRVIMVEIFEAFFRWKGENMVVGLQAQQSK